MKRVLFFLLMIFVSFGVIADCEIQAKDHDCFTIFAKGTIFSAFPVLNNKAMWRWYQNEDIGEYYWQTELGTCKNNKFTPSGARLLIRVGSLRLNENHAIKGTLQELINTAEKTAFLGDRFRSYIRAGIYQKKSSDPVQLLAVLDNSIMVKYFKDEKPTYARMTAHLPNKNESYECLILMNPLM
ncbi:protein YbfC, partial [Escherichia coli]